VIDTPSAVRAQLARQVAHWSQATHGLEDLTQFASPAAWQALERYLGATLRSSLADSIQRLERQAAVVRAQLLAAETTGELAQVQRAVLRLRRQYSAVESILDFYGDAINTRTNPRLGAYLSACDQLAWRSMRAVLAPLGHETPPALTYVEKGDGASILKAGLRLWDGRSISRVAAIKITRHNLCRPTALLHEAGHQVAHILDWTGELAEALRRRLEPLSPGVGTLWGGWASEAAADAFAFAHSGYAAVAALHDVLSTDRESVMRVRPLDPHPASYLRVLLGCEMCRTFFGAGAWDELALAWEASYPLAPDGDAMTELLRGSRLSLREAVEVLFRTKYSAFRGRALRDVLDPARVKPDALLELEDRAGKALFTSSHWIDRECLRLLALSGYRAAVEPTRARELAEQQRAWMSTLGEHARAA
jgi:hypothetical protein